MKALLLCSLSIFLLVACTPVSHSGRGIILSWVPGMPSFNELEGEFSLGVVAENGDDETLTLVMRAWDTAREDVVDFKNTEQTLIIAGADYSQKPAVFGEAIAQFGPYAYHNAIRGDTVQFHVEGLIENLVTRQTLQFCGGKPVIRGAGCRILEGVRIDGGEHDSVALVSVEKQLQPKQGDVGGGMGSEYSNVRIGSEGVATGYTGVKLIMTLANAGRGDVVDEVVTLDFSQVDSGVVYQCRPLKEFQVEGQLDYQKLPIEVHFVRDRAVVECVADVSYSAERSEELFVSAEIMYDYRVQLDSPLIPMRAGALDLGEIS